MILKKSTITNIAGDLPYLVRWSLRLPFGWSIKLHQILRPDDDRCVHDHPWVMIRVILWGGYVEQIGELQHGDLIAFRTRSRIVGHMLRTEPPLFGIRHLKPWRPWAPWRVYYCDLKFRHRITHLPRGQSWTLALCGPSVQPWGFFTHGGWMPWQKFVRLARTARVLWCDDGTMLNN